MSDVEKNIKKISDGIISYLEFLKLFKKVKNDDTISQEFENKNKFTYIFRQFELECYLIDKKYFDEFRKAINFNELISILNPISEENKQKFKIELKKYLDKNPFIPNGENIKLYSEVNEMKELVKNFNNYSFINKELLIAMGVPESKLEGKKMKVSKNGKNTSLLSVSNGFILSIEIEKKNQNNDEKEKEKENNEIKNKENKVYKNLYYLEEITKKVFVLLHFNEQFIQNKLKKNIKDIYNFKRYYLINNEWLKEYKEFFLFDFVEKKIESEYKNKNYSYNRIKHNLNNIVKNNLGQIKLYSETKLLDNIRKANNLIYQNKPQSIQKEIVRTPKEYEDENKDNEETFYIPIEFSLINEDLYRLLIKEEFFYNLDDKIEDIMSFDVLIGNNQIIIKNKAAKENEEKFKYSNEYLIYTLKNIKEENNKNGNEFSDKFILRYILNYDDDNIFYNDLDKIMKEGLNSYFEYRKLDKDIEINNEKLILDDKEQYIGKFINIDLNKEDIRNNIGIKINEQNKENYIDSIEINNNKTKINLENKETQTIINQNNKNNHIIENNDILDVNIMKENKDNNKLDENEIEKEKNKYIEKINNNDNKNLIIELNENNNNINGINHELNGKKNYEDKDIIIDNIIKEDNKSDENNIRNKEIDNKKHKNYKLYSIDELKDKRKKREIDSAFKDLSKNIIGNKELADLEINEINSNEILKLKDNPNLRQMFLMDEESSKKFQSLINYELLNEFINSDNKKKNYLIENNHEEFNKIYNILSGKIELTNEIKIIDEYKNCKKIMDMNKRFQLFGKIKHFNKGKNDFTYYFTFKNNSYIFFPKEMRVAKLKLNNDFNIICFI